MSFVKRLRDEQRFDSIEALKAQLQQDKQAAEEAMEAKEDAYSAEAGADKKEFPLMSETNKKVLFSTIFFDINQ